jgi:protein Mpv17
MIAYPTMWSATAVFRRLGEASLAPFRWYHRRLTEAPLLVKSLTSGTVLASADLLSQRLRRPPPLSEHETHRANKAGEVTHEHWWNAKQTMWMALYGSLFVAPFSHSWYQFLERRLPMPVAPSVTVKLRRVLQRVALDQVVVSPVFASGLFLSRGLIAGEDVQTIWTKTKADFTRVLLAGATIWPPAQMVNFFFVPLPYRVLFMNMVGFGWSTYTSLVASQAFYHPHLAKSEDRRRRLDPPPPLPPLFFMPRYMWMHSHPYTGRVPARPTYPTMNN